MCYCQTANTGAGLHDSHLEGNVVYGHQIHAVLASSGALSLVYSLKRCCPENGTKVDMTKAVIHSLPNTDQPVYVLMDSWYTNSGILDHCREKDFHLIGAMKTNRILYPNGSKFISSLTRMDTGWKSSRRRRFLLPKT